MQKERAISAWMLFSDFFLNSRRKFESGVLMMFIFGLFSNSAFAQLPLEDFNSGIPGTWVTASNQTVTSNWGPTTATGGYLNTPGATVNPGANTTTGLAEYFLITPQFVTPNATEIRFWTKQGSFQNRGTTYEVRLTTAQQPDIANFVVLQSWTEATLNANATTWEEKIITVPSIPAGVPVYIAFVASVTQGGTTATNGDAWFIDNARVITSCAKVTGITSTMSANGGLISWTHPSATNFEIQIVPQGNGIAASGTPVNGFTYNATGLADGTNYDVYIKTICDGTTASLWAGPFPVRTTRLGLGCATPMVIPPTNIATTPYVLSTNLDTFHDSPNYTPLDSHDFGCQPQGTNMNWLLGDQAFLSYTPTTTGLANVTLSVTTGAAPCFNGLISTFIFDSCPTGTNTPNCLGSLTTNNAPSVQLTNLYLQAGQTYWFVISSPFQHTQSAASICFTFTLSQPSCPIPSGLTYENLLHNSVSLAWANPQNLASAWQYIVKPASAGPPVGTDVTIPTGSNTNNVVSGLTPDTNYNLYVRAVCGGTPGTWSSALPFRTQCTTFTTPYSTQFTNATNDEPLCWRVLDLNGDNVKFGYSGAADNPPVQGQLARIRTMDTGNQTNDMLISPRITFDGVNQKQIRFKYKGFGGYTNSTGYVLGESSFMMKLSTTGIGPNNFTTELLPIATYQTGNNYIETIVVVPAGVVGDVNIAWYLPPGYVNTSTNFYIDDVYIEDLPACSPPRYPGVTAGSITQTQAQFYWTNGFNNTQWEVAVQPLNSGVPTGSGELVGTNPFTKTGLNPSTRYEYYVRTYCSSTLQSAWIGPVPFNTLCDAQPVPYYESLNDTDVTTKKFCWSIDNRNADGAKSVWTIDATQATIQFRDLFLNPFVNYDDYLVTAQINVVGNKMLKFKQKVVSTVLVPGQRTNFEVLMSTSPDMSNPTVLIPAHEVTNGDFEEDFVIFTGTGPAYFAFHLPANMTDPRNTGILTIDDFSIEDAPPCPNPSVLLATNIGTNSATLSWTPGYQETQWEIVVQNQGTGMPTGSGTVVNTNPTYNATGLTENSAYEYYVRAICGSNGNSQWIGPFIFRTICTPRPTPFLETFETNSPTETCWTIVNSNGDSNIWNMNWPVAPMFGEQMAGLDCYTNGNSNDWLISPTITVQPNQRLRFYYKNHYEPVIGNDLKVKLSTGGVDISQFTTTLYDTDVTGTFNNVETREMVINLPATITGPTNINIGFQVPPGTPGPEGLRGSYVNIDNVIIENIPACPSVYNIVTNVNSITDTTAQINWQSAGSETSWEISVQPYGTPAPVGNTLPQYLRTANAHPYTVTGLTASTRYQYYVRAICGSGSQSAWVGPVEVLTKCDLTNICGYTISLSNGGGSQGLAAIDVVQNGVVQQSLTFPVVAPGQPTVINYDVFLCRGIEWNLYWRGSGSGTQSARAIVEVRDQSGALVHSTTLGQHTINTTIYTTVSNCATVTCPQPTNLVVNNLGTLSWTPGGTETQWEVFVQPLGLGAIPQSGVIVNSASYTPPASAYINLLDGTNEFFVRAVCGSTDKSYWSGPFVYIKNDEPQTAIVLPVNTNGTCTTRGTKASYIGATVSSVPSTCGGVNGGDIWYEFVATSKIHTVELSNFTPGSYNAGGGASQDLFPKHMLSLYEVQTGGTLVEKACSDNNSLTTIYSSELTVGTTYKIRVAFNNTGVNDKKFDICVSTPENSCDVTNFNYSFEKIPMPAPAVGSYIFSRLVPGWRTNTNTQVAFFFEGTSAPGFVPYEGAQCIQIIMDPANEWNPNDPNIKGIYTDIETPTTEIQKVKYSFASATRQVGVGTTVELWAGPPSGPFTMVTDHFTASAVWSLRTGDYVVPAGQNVTRFIFRTRGNVNGHLLDAASFVPNTDVVTEDATLTCDQTSVNVTGEGQGEWVADTNNPAVTIIGAPTSSSTTISGYNTPGTYTYFWKTRYCEKPFTVTYQGFSDVATVTSPVEYCLGQTAVPLTANAPAGFTLEWYTEAVGGTGNVNAPTPSTATVGTTTYYVALVNPNGCVGPRIPLNVTVNDLTPSVVTFTYDKDLYCTSGDDPIITPAAGFTTGGTFTATPVGLSIDPATGNIDISASAGGEYVITYAIGSMVNGCNLEGTFTSPTTVKVNASCVIPRGISPNGDGMNDTFDLTGMDVKELIIFNRYGMKVYTHGEGYEKEWNGLSDDGDKLPDGTYFYNIVKGDNSTVTGWVYINRQY